MCAEGVRLRDCKRTRRQRGLSLMIVDDCSLVGGVLRPDKSARGDVNSRERGPAGGVGSACGRGPPVRRRSDIVSPVGSSCLGCCGVRFCSFKCLLFIVTLFVIAAKQICPQGAIKLELNYTELQRNEKHSTAGSLATASWCTEPELEEYAHTISPKRAQTKVPQILNFPPASVRNSFFL